MRYTSRPLSRRDQLVVQEHDGEVLIYDLRRNKAFCLNITAALVWQACDGTREVSEIAAHIADKLDERDPDALVWLALDRLKKEDLIEGESDPDTSFNGTTRRDVIKRLGTASMVVLPVI